MSISQFCIQQRQQEQQKIKRLLILGFTSSALLHGILVWAIPKWSVEPQKVTKPMELIIVNKPQPKPKPKVESKPIVEPKPKPLPKPEPIKAKTPPPPVKPPEPVKAQTAPPKPAPQKVLTNPTPAPSQPIVSAPIQDTAKTPSFDNSFTTSNSSAAVEPENISGNGNPGTPGNVVSSNSAPPRPGSGGDEGISCISNCEPEYPAVLEGAEGNAGVKLTIDSEGNVIGAELSTPNSNSQVNRQALLAARQMEFSPPSGGNASVQIKIEFTLAGSEYDRLAREEQEEREQAKKERQEQETARQQQLEQERQARQQQLEQERQARQQQLEAEKPAETNTQSKPVPNSQTAPKPLPPLETEMNDEMLRKFRQRIENRR
jgi:periplasmic protein TonB